MNMGPVTKDTEHSVSCRYLGWIFSICREYRIPISEALEGIEYSEKYLLVESNYVRWVTFQKLVSNMSRFLTQTQIIDIGRESFKRPLFIGFAAAGRLIGVKSSYRWLATEVLPRLYPIIAVELHHTSDKLHLHLTFERKLPACPELFWIIEGQFQTLSSMSGYRESKVLAVHRDRDSEFIISFAKRSTLLGTLKRWFRKPFDYRTSVREWRSVQTDLLQTSRDLEIETGRMDQASTRISGLEMQNDLLEQSLLDMIWMTDLDDQFIYVSPAIKSMFGYEVEAASRMNFFDLLSLDSDENLFNLLGADTRSELEKSAERHGADVSPQSHARPKSRVFEVLAVRADGTEFWCEIHRSFHYNEAGGLQAITGVTRDITERKQNENEKALLEKELTYARHMESIGQLAGGIAHDFNNMLTTVLGFSDLARDGVGDEHKISPYLEEISRAGARASDLVKQLLTFGKQQPMAPVPLDLNDLMAEIEPMLKRLVAENIELMIDTQSIPIVLGDAVELERVLLNLCINACDAMPEGGRLIISTREYLLSNDDNRALKAGTDSFACIAVSDTGIGIKPEDQQRVLEPFFTTKPFGQGTGLGLAVTYSIVQQHKGFLDLVSHPNKGTTVKVFLPRTELTMRPIVVDEQEITLDHHGTILVVEDQTQVRKLLVQILQSSGYKVFQASDGIEAVSTFERFANQIDLVLMDIVMPKMGGRDALTLIRKVKLDAKVLFMTGYAGEDPKIDFAAASGHPVLRKPFSSGDVVRRVNELLSADKP